VTRPRILLIGTGVRTYRDYLLSALAEDYDVWLFSERDPDWEQPYLIGHTVLDITDVDAMAAAASTVAPDGVLTWEDPRVVHTARLARALGLPGCSPAAALRCRDKHATRTALAAAGVPQAGSALVSTLSQARAAAEAIGYPLVLKARALAASIGVVAVDGPDQLAARFRIARGATAPNLTELPPGDVLVEQYLTGPEISVDAAWSGGTMALAFVAHKQLGYPPYFEEIGHLVDADDPLHTDSRLHEVLRAAHAAIGFDTGWTHTELRLTPDGPKVVEINARLGGDRIPHVAELATGIRAAPVAAAVACGGMPAVAATVRRVAAIRFCYPDRDTVARGVHIDRARLPSTVVAVEPIAVPGQELRLPPAGHVTSRYGYLTVVGDTAERCAADLAVAAAAITLEALGGPAVNTPAGRLAVPRA
jgi:biotin carboxylase